MGNLLTRRRELILPSASSEWDYEWNAQTDQIFPPSPAVKQSGGTVAEELAERYISLKTAGGSGTRYIQYAIPSLRASTGVLEACFGVVYRASNAGGWGRVCFGDENGGVSVIFSAQSANSGKICLWDKSSVGSCTQIGTFKSGDQQKIRIELDNGVGRVFLNDVLAADNIDAYAQYYSNSVLIANVQNFNENNNYHYGFFLWAKVKSGRL